MDVGRGEVVRAAVPGGGAVDAAGLHVDPDPGGLLFAAAEDCSTSGPGEECSVFVVDPEARTATSLAQLSDPRFEGRPRQPVHLGAAPDGTALAACFSAGTPDDRSILVAIAATDDPEWKVIAEFGVAEAGLCVESPAWSEHGIAVPLCGEEKHLLLTPAG